MHFRKQEEKFTYKKYLHHLSFQCPLACSETAMSAVELKTHLMEHCPLSEIECSKCLESCFRSQFKKHKPSHCIEVLKATLKKENEKCHKLFGNRYTDY